MAGDKATRTGRQLHGKVETRGAERDAQTSRSFEESTRVDKMPTRTRKESTKLERENEKRADESEAKK